MSWLSRDYARVELAFGADLTQTPDQWTWVDVSQYLRDSDDPRIQRSRGRHNEYSETSPSEVSLTLNNDDGRFTPDNATSPFYPNVRRGVPIRITLTENAPTPKTLVSDAFGRTLSGAWGTPDTGIEWQTVALTDDQPTPSVDGSTGLLTLDGVLNIRTAMVQGTAAVDADYRVTVGLNAVPAGTDEQVQIEIWTRTRYQNVLQVRTSGAIWARLDRADGVPDLGTVLTASDRTTINALEDTGLVFTGAETYEVRIQTEGTIHRFKVWESGTVEPGPWLWEVDDGTYPAGVVALGGWAGGSQTNDPLVWSFDDLTVTELAAPPLFLGQVVQWAPQWPAGDGQDYSQVSLVAGGVLRQQGQRKKQAHSAMRSGMSALEPNSNAIAYWPCEDAVGARQMAPGFTTHGPLAVAGDVVGAASQPLETSEPLPQLNSGSLSGLVPPYSGSTHSLTMVLQVPSGGLSNGGLIARLNFTGGDLVRAEFRYATGGEAQVTLVDVDDNSDTSSVSTTLDMDGELLIVRCSVFPGPIISSEAWGRFFVFYADDNGEFNTGANFDDATGAAILAGTTAGRIGSIQVGGGLGAAIVGHPIVSTLASSTFTILPANGFPGESAVERFVRVSSDAGIAAAVTGNPALSELMGKQRTGLALDILRECADLDGGIMSELNTRLGLGYRARHTLYNQTPALTLDASAPPAGEIQNPFEPILNDLDIVNDVTVSRDGGSSARIIDQASIDAEGQYDEQITLNAFTDAQLPDLASWRLHLGTWPGMRYPTLSSALNADADLIPVWVALDLGDMVRVTGLPSQHPAGPVDMLVQGTTDTLTPTSWEASGNMSPEGPYHVPVIGGDAEFATIGSTGASLNAALNTTETAVQITCGAGADWVHEVDFDILIGGERMTVTAVGVASGTFPDRIQTLNVTRSVNGVVKTHSDGDPIAMADPVFIG